MKQLPQARGRQPWAGPRLDVVPCGWQLPVGSPRFLRRRGLKGPLRLGYLRQDPAPAPSPEGECVRVCVCVSVSEVEGVVGRLGAGWIQRLEGEGCRGRGWEACVVPLMSLSLPLSPSPLPGVSGS